MNLQDMRVSYTVNETISNPTNPAEVIGFIGRDRTLGNDALLFKHNCTRETGRLPVPGWVVAHAIEDETEIVVVGEDNALIALHGLKTLFSVIRNRGQRGPDKLNVIDTEHDNFTEVEIENVTTKINP